MTAETTSPQSVAPEVSKELARAQAFVEDLKGMAENRRGDLAALKRNAGNTIPEARGIAWFHGMLARHGVGERNAEAYFLIATLLPADRRFLDGRSAFSGDFGQTMARVAPIGDAAREGIDRRFRILLDAGSDPDGGGEMLFRLRQMVKLALSKEAPIGWARLLYDLTRWNNDRKPVQKAWAQHFYAPALPDESEGETTVAE